MRIHWRVVSPLFQYLQVRVAERSGQVYENLEIISRFVCCTWYESARISSRRRNGKGVDERGFGITEVLTWQLPGGTEEKHRKK
jgi:hypothetical protein